MSTIPAGSLAGHWGHILQQISTARRMFVHSTWTHTTIPDRTSNWQTSFADICANDGRMSTSHPIFNLKLSNWSVKRSTVNGQFISTSTQFKEFHSAILTSLWTISKFHHVSAISRVRAAGQYGPHKLELPIENICRLLGP